MGKRNNRNGSNSGWVTNERTEIVVTDAFRREAELYNGSDDALAKIRERIAAPRPTVYRIDCRVLPFELGDRVISAIRLEHYIPILAIRERCNQILSRMKEHVCLCEHEKIAHEHFHRLTYCAICDCTKYRRRWI